MFDYAVDGFIPYTCCGDYILADKDFTIDGRSVAPWLVEASGANYTYNLVDTLSGETIISSYSGYQFVTQPGAAIYVYAKKADGGMDIYIVK